GAAEVYVVTTDGAFSRRRQRGAAPCRKDVGDAGDGRSTDGQTNEMQARIGATGRPIRLTLAPSQGRRASRSTAK
ncbi:MAG: hypothetical protein AAF763_12655, partial [Pseudomonadota bacterium]